MRFTRCLSHLTLAGLALAGLAACSPSAAPQAAPAAPKQWAAEPEMQIDPNKQYLATLDTVKGKIVVELLPKAAPRTVNNFVFLARQGYYDGVTFHRVIPDFVAQGGDPTGTGRGGPGYFIPNEVLPDLTFSQPGLVAMANAGPDTNGSQFFITFAALPNLDGGYTIFGQVATGLEVALALTPRDPQQNPNAPPGDVINTITIEEK
jgi:cyclophilin family peptidyl-prolyl cis-trans isomerase